MHRTPGRSHWLRRFPPLVSALIAATLVVSCATKGGQPTPPPAEPRLAVLSFGENTGAGNIVAVQPFIFAQDYASSWLLSAKLENYLEQAKRKKWLTKKTLVVFPAGTATWLLAADEAQNVYQARTLEDVQRLLREAHLLEYGSKLPFSRAEDSHMATVVTIKSIEAAKIAQEMFRRMAREYGVTIVAGTFWLASPAVSNGRLEAKDTGDIYSVAVVYGPDGQALANPIHELQPSVDHAAFVAPGQAQSQQVIETAAGRLGIVVGQDGWSAAQQNYKPEDLDILVSLPWLQERGSWTRPWPGLQAESQPAHIAPDDVGTITRQQAWSKYGPTAGCGKNSTTSVSVFLRGHLWGQQPDGQTMVCHNGQVKSGPHRESPLLLNIWLGAPAEHQAEQATSQAGTAEAKTDSGAAAESVNPEKEKKKHKKKKSKKGKKRRSKKRK